MKFHHLNNDANEATVTTILGSHSEYKGIKASVNQLEENHGLPRPPFTNGKITATKQDSLNGTTNTKDGVELQQKKVILQFQIVNLYFYIYNDYLILL